MRAREARVQVGLAGIFLSFVLGGIVAALVGDVWSYLAGVSSAFLLVLVALAVQVWRS